MIHFRTGRRLGMRFTRFTLEVQKVATPVDYAANGGLLIHVKDYQRDLFLEMLMLGADIPAAIKTIPFVWEITKHTHLCLTDIVRVQGLFRSLFKALEDSLKENNRPLNFLHPGGITITIDWGSSPGPYTGEYKSPLGDLSDQSGG